MNKLIDTIGRFMTIIGMILFFFLFNDYVGINEVVFNYKVTEYHSDMILFIAPIIFSVGLAIRVFFAKNNKEEKQV